MAEPLLPRQMIHVASKLGETIGRCENRDLAKQASVALDSLFEHITALEDLLDEGDENDSFGTEGWRHRLGID